jgi:hypothetical protein
LAEAESELVAGFHTEYSGLRWSYFFMAEYGSMFLVSALAAILFLGGWNGPIPVFELLDWPYDQGATDWQLGGYLANLFGCANLLFKAATGVMVMMWVRWTLPRIRIDQVITTCLKYCVPLAAIGFLGAVCWSLADWPSLNDLAPVTEAGPAGVREGWVLKAETPEQAPREGEGDRTAASGRPAVGGLGGVVRPAPNPGPRTLNPELRTSNPEPRTLNPEHLALGGEGGGE